MQKDVVIDEGIARFSNTEPITRCDVSIVVPAWNEEHRITLLLDELKHIFAGENVEVLLVDDGSEDETSEKAVQWGKANDDFPLIVLRLNENSGKGNAIKAGIRHTTGIYVSFIDADLDIHPNELKRLLEEAKTENADIVVGTKKDWNNTGVNFQRKVLSTAFRFVNRMVLHLSISDTQTGCKVFRGDWIRKHMPRVECKGYLFDLELLGIAEVTNQKIMEIPIHIQRETGKENRIKIKAILETLVEYIGAVRRVKTQKRKLGKWKGVHNANPNA